LLKVSSWVAKARIVALLPVARAALTCAITWAVVSG
jgi:hypothetical protein